MLSTCPALGFGLSPARRHQVVALNHTGILIGRPRLGRVPGTWPHQGVALVVATWVNTWLQCPFWGTGVGHS